MGDDGIEFDGDLGEFDLDAEPEGGVEVGVEGNRGAGVRATLSGSFMTGFFNDLFDGEELRHLTREGAFAFVDALSVALVADGKPEDEELVEFRTQLERLPFSVEDIEAIQDRVVADIDKLAAYTDEELSGFIVDVGARITSDALKERALRMAVAITHADYAVTGEEARVLGMMAEGFGVSRERIDALIDEVKDAGEGDLLY
jgi:uncharacterized tellurite resistance protein B-like protein